MIEINNNHFDNLNYNKNHIELHEYKFKSFKYFFEVAKNLINQSKSENQIKTLNFSKIKFVDVE